MRQNLSLKLNLFGKKIIKRSEYKKFSPIKNKVWWFKNI